MEASFWSERIYYPEREEQRLDLAQTIADAKIDLHKWRTLELKVSKHLYQRNKSFHQATTDHIDALQVTISFCYAQLRKI